MLRYRPLLLLLALGVAVRIATMALFFPAVMTSYDSPRFARADPQGLFDDYWMPAGYPAFLKVLHNVSDHVWFTIGVQHAIGVGVALLLFATARRLGASPALACVPAAFGLLSGDLLYLEHIFLADAFMLALCVAGLSAAVWGLHPVVDLRRLALAGALLACAALSRPPAAVVLLVLVGVAAVVGTRPGARLPRIGSPAAAVAGALVIFALYGGAFAIKDGRYLGVGDMSGWLLYGRAAPFADCGEFTPPKGTRVLCDPRPAAQRPGPFGYVWPQDSAARKAFTPLGPESGERPGAFARAALLHQPGSYLSAVGLDLVRFVEPDAGAPKPFSGQGRDLVSFGFRDAGVEKTVIDGLARRYAGTELHAPGTDLLQSYQSLVRVDRLALATAIVLTLLGMALARGPLRHGTVLFGLSGLGLYLLPALTISYDFRYGIPPSALVVMSATLAAAGLLERRRLRRSALPDDEELLAEQPPRERRREVAARQAT
jgi:hypothetical protein